MKMGSRQRGFWALRRRMAVIREAERVRPRAKAWREIADREREPPG